MASTFAEAAIKITAQADQAGISRQLAGIEKAISDSAGRMSSLTRAAIGAVVGALPIAAGVAMVKISADVGDELAKMSQRVGIGVETLSGYRLAADLAGTSLEDFGVSMQRASKAIFDARDGTGETADAFRDLGISVVDQSGNLKTAEQVLLEVSDRFAGMENGARKTALAMEIFGRGGASMIPLLNQGSEALRKQREEADALGVTWTTAQAKLAEGMNDSLETLEAALAGFRNRVATYLMPFVTSMVDAINGKIKGLMASGELQGLALQIAEWVLKIPVWVAEAVAAAVQILPKLADGFKWLLGEVGSAVSGISAFLSHLIEAVSTTLGALTKIPWIGGKIAGGIGEARAALGDAQGIVDGLSKSAGKFGNAWQQSMGQSIPWIDKVAAGAEGASQKFKEWAASSMMAASKAMYVGEASSKAAAKADESIQDVLARQDKAWAHAKAMGEVSIQDEIQRLQDMMNEAGRTTEQRLKAEEELSKLTQETADRMFAHEESLGLKSLQDKIDFEKRKADAAVAGTDRQMKAQEDAFKLEEDLRKRRQQAALGIVGDVLKELEAEGLGEEAITKADFDRKLQEIQIRRGQEALATQQWAAGGGAMTLGQVQAGLESAGKLTEANQQVQQIGTVGQILQQGATVARGAVTEQIGMAISDQTLRDLLSAGREDLAQKALARLGPSGNLLGGEAFAAPGGGIGESYADGMSSALDAVNTGLTKIEARFNESNSRIGKAVATNMEEWFVRKLMLQSQRE
jgi:hypothetical protein